MKKGICLLLIANCEDPLGKGWIERIAKSGYDYAEVSLARIYSLPEEEVREYRALFRRNELPVLAFNNAVPAGFSIIGDEVTDQRQQEYMDRAVALASEFGVETITTSGPNQKRLPDGFDWENKGRARYIAFLQRFADKCREKGITLALEPICSEEKGLINTTQQAMEIIRAVDRSNMKLIVDLFHFSLEGEDPKVIAQCAREGYLCHLHVASFPARTIPDHLDGPKIARLIRDLRQSGFEGLISIEARAQDPETAIPIGAEVLDAAIRFAEQSYGEANG